jgi:Flp pilus assembly protein TadD
VSSSAVRSLRQQAQTETGQGNVADAVATIERALRIEPENPDLWLVLSDLYKQQGNVQQAASMAAKAQYYQELLH